jgi:hypothetical protein
VNRDTPAFLAQSSDFQALSSQLNTCGLIIEAKQGDVAVVEYVFLALEPVFSGFACGRNTTELREIVV